MKIFGTVTAAVATAALALSGIGAAVAVEQDSKSTEKWKDVSFFTLKTKSLAGEPVELAKYDGKVVLVVNVASKCGFTPQYAGLEKLFKELESKGLVVIGFPSNDFGGQEPGSAEEIRAFCTKNYGVTFPMMEKVQTKAGEGQSEIYNYLGTRTGSLPSWNFGKYLVGRDGAPIAYFSSKVAPDAKELREAIEKALAAKPAAKASAPAAESSPR
jgi:glutathione peroxidase